MAMRIAFNAISYVNPPEHMLQREGMTRGLEMDPSEISPLLTAAR